MPAASAASRRVLACFASAYSADKRSRMLLMFAYIHTYIYIYPPQHQNI